jgi:hypothetical protein
MNPTPIDPEGDVCQCLMRAESPGDVGSLDCRGGWSQYGFRMSRHRPLSIEGAVGALDQTRLVSCDYEWDGSCQQSLIGAVPLPLGPCPGGAPAG